MVRLIARLLWLVAVLVAPLPAAAAPVPAPALEMTSAGHCDEGKAAQSDQHRQSSPDDGDRDCCTTMGHCCPAAMPIGAQPARARVDAGAPAHGARVEHFRPGLAGSPLTEPPTLT